MEQVSITMSTYFFDASAIVKLIVTEPGSNVARELLVDCGFAHTSWVLLAEVLNVLKRKKQDGQLSHDGYREAVYMLFSYISGHSLDPIDIEVRDGRARLVTHESEVFGNIKQFPNLDVADTLQLTAITDSFLRYFSGPSRAKLVTADSGLKAAAESMGIPVIMVNNDVAQ